MRPLVNRSSPLTHASHCITTSWPAAATQTRVRVSPAMQPTVFYAGCPSCLNPPYFRARWPARNMLACIPWGYGCSMSAVCTMNISKVNQCLWKHRTSHKYRCVHWSCVIWCSGYQRHHRHPVGWHTTNTCLCCATMPYTGSSCVFVWCMPFMPTYKWQWTMYVHIIFPLVTNTHAYIFHLFVMYVKSGQCLLAIDDIIIITRAATDFNCSIK